MLVARWIGATYAILSCSSKGSQALDVEEKQGNGVCPSTRTVEVQKLSNATNCLSPGPGASLAPGVSADYSGPVGFVKFLDS